MLSLPWVVPLPLVFLHSLCLLVILAIEATGLQWLLGYPPRRSVQYSLIINLFSQIGITALVLQNLRLLPERWQIQAMSYVFFGNRQWTPWDITGLGVTVVVMFMLFCYLEWKLLVFLDQVLTLTIPPQHPWSDSEFKKNLQEKMAQFLQLYDLETLPIVMLLNLISSVTVMILFILLRVMKH